MKYYIHTFLLLLLVGCNYSPKQIYERYSNFPDTQELYAEAVYLDSTFFRYPFRVAALGDVILIQDLHNADHYLHAYSLSTQTHLASFIPRGEGPGEMITCETFQFNSLDSIWALDPNKMEIHRYHLVPEEQAVTLVEVIPVNKQLLASLDLVVTSEGFIVPDFTGEYRYHTLNWQGEVTGSGGFIPKESKLIPNIAMAQGWRPFFDYNERYDRLAVATQLGEVLEIYSLKDTVHIVKYGPHGEPEFVEKEGNGYPDGIKGFVDIQITYKYIYVIFEGSNFKQKFQDFMDGKEPPGGGNNIYVFDHEGNPVRKYILDHYIYSLHVNEEGGYFYALDLNQNDPLLKYSFHGK